MLESCSAFFRRQKKLGINALDKKGGGPKTVVAASIFHPVPNRHFTNLQISRVR